MKESYEEDLANHFGLDVDGGFRLSRFGVLAGGGWRNWLAAFLRS
jgi:hypothetical protein